MTHDDDVAVCAASVGLEGFRAKFAELTVALGQLFTRRDLRENALAYLRGLLMPGVAGNCWAIAEAVGHARPHRLQHLLAGAVWDEDAARDVVRSFVVRHLGPGWSIDLR